jgi:hypothetical protein
MKILHVTSGSTPNPSPTSTRTTAIVEVLPPARSGSGRRFDITARVVAADPSMGAPSGVVTFNIDGSDEPEDVQVQGGDATLRGEVLDIGRKVRIQAIYKPSRGESFLGAKSEAKTFDVN